jgi:hypothetical protein
MTSQEKTFEAIAKLQEIELELHRLRNALDRANKALDAQRKWTGLTNEELTDLFYNENLGQMSAVGQAIELLKERNQ